jgi:hypothetical protein
MQGKFTAVILVILAHIGKYAASELCNALQQVEYGSAQVRLLKDESMQDVWGFNYPPGAFWKEDNETYVGCPCSMKRCIQHCSS